MLFWDTIFLDIIYPRKNVIFLQSPATCMKKAQHWTSIFKVFFLMFLAVAFIKDNYFMVYNVLQYIQYVALYLLLFDAAAAPLFLGRW